MSKIQFGSILHYEVKSPTIFLFKIAAAWTQHQYLTDEVLTVTPNMNIQQCQIGPEGNRLHRVNVQPGELAVRYEAVADMSPGIERSRDVDEAE